MFKRPRERVALAGRVQSAPEEHDAGQRAARDKRAQKCVRVAGLVGVVRDVRVAVRMCRGPVRVLVRVRAGVRGGCACSGHVVECDA